MTKSLKDHIQNRDTKPETKEDKNDPANWRDGYCPFTSTPEAKQPCNPDCALYRSGKQPGYACPFTELTSMSWMLKGAPRKK